MKRHLLALAALAMAAPALAQAPAPETERSISSGALIGFVEENGAHVWRGVPFAADTGGQNRWRAPRPAPSWEGVREATSFGPRCPQIANAFTQSDEPFENGDLLGDEACLNLDIYAPATADPAAPNLPVMVWIHGGSNVSGASSAYQGHKLAQNENVIVVSVQYRLGPLGWFAHPALRESAETIEDASANFGTLDLIAALEWVQEDILSFGGDPDNVTIFGESAGGHNVATLLASPRAEGLFHRAIIQSGSFDSITLAEAEGRDGDQPNPSLEVAPRLGGPAKFHTASTAEVFAAYELGEGSYLDLPRIVQDGVILPETPLRNAFASPETFNAVPIITGINRDEMRLFQVLDPRFTRRRLGRFIVARDQSFYDASSDYGSRVWRIRAVDMPAQLMAAGGHDAVWAYRFDWDNGGRVFLTDLEELLGAAHSMEIPFVFNRFKLLGEMDKFMFQKKTAEERETLSRAMGSYWASFARTGAPALEGGPAWPVYNLADPTLLRFDSERDGGIEIMRGADSFEAILADIKADKRLNSIERCLLGAGLSRWLPDVKSALQCDAISGILADDTR